MSRGKKDLFRHFKSSLFQDYKAKKKRPEQVTEVVNIHRRFTSRIRDFYFDITHPLLTYPSQRCQNDGIDNIDYNLIVRKNFVFNSRYKAESVLGSGVFGIVYMCVDLKTGEEVAIKIVRSKPEYLKQSETEINILNRLRKSHYVVKVLSSFFECNHRFIVFELLPYSVFKLLKSSNFRGFGMHLLSRLAKLILKGINDLHRHTIIHTDLKPENVMLTKKSVEKFDKKDFLRIIDFSNALDFSELKIHLQVADGSDILQSRFYRSPEVFLGCCDVISEKLDLWSFGVMIYELYKGRPLFAGCNDFQILKKMIRVMGSPPTWMVKSGKFSHLFFHPNGDLRTEEEYILTMASNGKKVSRGKLILEGMEEEEEDVKDGNEADEERISLKQRIMEHIIVSKDGTPVVGEETKEYEETKELLYDFLKFFIRWDPNFRVDSQDALRHQFLEFNVSEIGENCEEEEEEKVEEEEDEGEEEKKPSEQPRRQLTFSVKDISGDVTTRKRKNSFSSFMDNDDALMEVVRKDRQQEKIQKMREKEPYDGEEESEDESVTTSEGISSSGEDSEEDIIAALNREHFDYEDFDSNHSPTSTHSSTSSSSYTSAGSISSTTSSITRGLGTIVGGQYGGMAGMGGQNRWDRTYDNQQIHQQSPSSFEAPYYEYYGDKSGHHRQRQFQYEFPKTNSHNFYGRSNNNRHYRNGKRNTNSNHMKRTVSVPSTIGKFKESSPSDRRTRRGSTGLERLNAPSSTNVYHKYQQHGRKHHYSRNYGRRQPSSLDFDNRRRRGKGGMRKNEVDRSTDRSYRSRNGPFPNYRQKNQHNYKHHHKPRQKGYGRDGPPNGPSQHRHRGSWKKRARGRGGRRRKVSKSAGSHGWRGSVGGGRGRRRSSYGGSSALYHMYNRQNDVENRGDFHPSSSEKSSYNSDSTRNEGENYRINNHGNNKKINSKGSYNNKSHNNNRSNIYNNNRNRRGENNNNNNNNNSDNQADGFGTEVWNSMRGIMGRFFGKKNGNNHDNRKEN